MDGAAVDRERTGRFRGLPRVYINAVKAVVVGTPGIGPVVVSDHNGILRIKPLRSQKLLIKMRGRFHKADIRGK